MPKKKITKELLKEIESLAERGLSNALISKSLNLGLSTLSMNVAIKEAIQKGKLSLAKRITKSVLDTIDDNPSTQQMLIKRLGLFLPNMNIKKPKSTKDAIENLSIATKQYADGEINESQLRTIEAVSNSYIRNYEIEELEDRVKKLEEKIENAKKED